MADPEFKHPIRGKEIRIYMPMKPGHKFLAQFGDGGTWPILFRADSALAVNKMAEDFREDVLAKHEAAYQAKQARKAALKQSRAKA